MQAPLQPPPHHPPPHHPPPQGWPRITAGITYGNAAPMIDWLCQAFGFTLRLKVQGADGRIQHSELTFGDAVVMVGEERLGEARRFETDLLSPAHAGGVTNYLMVYVDDVDAHHAQAAAAGARIVSAPELHDHGAEHWADRSYGALDPEGHLWWFTQRVRG